MVVAAAFVVVESLLLLPISVVVLDVVVAVVVVAVLLVFDISFERSLLSGKSGLALKWCRLAGKAAGGMMGRGGRCGWGKRSTRGGLMKGGSLKGGWRDWLA